MGRVSKVFTKNVGSSIQRGCQMKLSIADNLSKTTASRDLKQREHAEMQGGMLNGQGAGNQKGLCIVHSDMYLKSIQNK